LGSSSRNTGNGLILREPMKWVNDAVDVASGLGYVELMSAALMISLILLLSCAGFFYFGELYKLLPGWGPVTKFDAEAGEDIRVRQHVLYQEKRAQDKKDQLAAAGKGKDSYGSMDYQPTGRKNPDGSLVMQKGRLVIDDQGRRFEVGNPAYPESCRDEQPEHGYVRADWDRITAEREADPEWPRDEYAVRAQNRHGGYKPGDRAYAKFMYRLV